MTVIACKIHNRGPSRQIFFSVAGEQTIDAGQTLDVELDEGTFSTMRNYFDDSGHGLDLVSIESEKTGEPGPAGKTDDGGDGGNGGGDGVGSGDGVGEGDSVEKLLGDVAAERINYPQLRSNSNRV
jgi:hypothetical protein